MTIYPTEKQLEQRKHYFNILENKDSEYISINDLSTKELDEVVDDLTSAECVKFNKRPNVNFVHIKKNNVIKKYVFSQDAVELDKNQAILKVSKGNDYLVELVLRSDNSKNSVFDNKYSFSNKIKNEYIN